ncbi:hypothetical protein BKA65DRAFT_514944 [Rhexocercosporidium sp. MPI-PUGE-AT-0058]|nr:hypothetical protein BKA65DRAFT_514944 [Rhexocercosporidium sp. MPI-PUGE-AT-0058]
MAWMGCYVLYGTIARALRHLPPSILPPPSFTPAALPVPYHVHVYSLLLISSIPYHPVTSPIPNPNPNPAPIIPIRAGGCAICRCCCCVSSCSCGLHARPVTLQSTGSERGFLRSLRSCLQPNQTEQAHAEGLMPIAMATSSPSITISISISPPKVRVGPPVPFRQVSAAASGSIPKAFTERPGFFSQGKAKTCDTPLPFLFYPIIRNKLYIYNLQSHLHPTR